MESKIQDFDRASVKYAISVLRKENIPDIVEQQRIAREVLTYPNVDAKSLLEQRHGLGAIMLYKEDAFPKWLQTPSGKRMYAKLFAKHKLGSHEKKVRFDGISADIPGDPWGPYETDLKKIVANAKQNYLESGLRPCEPSPAMFLTKETIIPCGNQCDPKFIRESLLGSKEEELREALVGITDIKEEEEEKIECPACPPCLHMEEATAAPSETFEASHTGNEYVDKVNDLALAKQILEKDLVNARREIQEHEVNGQKCEQEIRKLNEKLVTLQGLEQKIMQDVNPEKMKQDMENLESTWKSKVDLVTQEKNGMLNDLRTLEAKVSQAESFIRDCENRIKERETDLRRMEEEAKSVEQARARFEQDAIRAHNEVVDRDEQIRKLERDLRNAKSASNVSGSGGHTHYYGSGEDLRLARQQIVDLERHIEDLKQSQRIAKRELQSCKEELARAQAGATISSSSLPSTSIPTPPSSSSLPSTSISPSPSSSFLPSTSILPPPSSSSYSTFPASGSLPPPPSILAPPCSQEEIDQLKKKSNSLNEELQKMTAMIDSLETENRRLKSVIEEENTEISSLKNQNENLNISLAQLSSEEATKDEKFALLNSQYDNNLQEQKSEIAKLQAQLAENQKEKEQMSDELSLVKSEKAALKQAHDDCNHKQVMTEQKVLLLEANNAQLQEQLKKIPLPSRLYQSGVVPPPPSVAPVHPTPLYSTISSPSVLPPLPQPPPLSYALSQSRGEPSPSQGSLPAPMGSLPSSSVPAASSTTYPIVLTEARGGAGRRIDIQQLSQQINDVWRNIGRSATPQFLDQARSISDLLLSAAEQLQKENEQIQEARREAMQAINYAQSEQQKMTQELAMVKKQSENECEILKQFLVFLDEMKSLWERVRTMRSEQIQQQLNKFYEYYKVKCPEVKNMQSATWLGEMMLELKKEQTELLALEDKSNQQNLNMQKEIEELKHNLQEREALESVVDARINDLEAELGGIKAQKTECDNEKQLLEEEKERLNEELKTLANAQNALNNSNQELEKELEKEREEYQTKLYSLETQLQTERACDKELEKCKKERDDCSALLKNCSEEVVKLNEAIQKISRESEELKKEKEKIGSEKQDAKISQREIEEMLQNAKVENQSLQKASQQNAEKQKELEEALSKTNKETQQMREKIEKQKEEIEKQKEDLREKAEKLHTKEENAQKDIENLTEKQKQIAKEHTANLVENQKEIETLGAQIKELEEARQRQRTKWSEENEKELEETKRQLKGEKKELENTMREEKEIIRRQLTNLEKEKENINKELNDVIREKEGLENQVKEVKKANTRVEEESAKKQTDIQAQKEEIERNWEKVKKLGQQIESQQAENETLKGQLETQKKEQDKKYQQLEKEKGEVSRQLQQKQRQANILGKSIEEREKEAKILKQRLKEESTKSEKLRQTEQKLQNVRSEVEKIVGTARQGDLEELVKQLAVNLEAMKKEKREIAIGKAEIDAKLQSKQKEFEEQLRLLKQKMMENEGMEKILTRQDKELRTQKKQLDESKQKFDKEVEDLRKQFETLKEEKTKLEKGSADIQEKLTKATSALASQKAGIEKKQAEFEVLAKDRTFLLQILTLFSENKNVSKNNIVAVISDLLRKVKECNLDLLQKVIKKLRSDLTGTVSDVQVGINDANRLASEILGNYRILYKDITGKEASDAPRQEDSLISLLVKLKKVAGIVRTKYVSVKKEKEDAELALEAQKKNLKAAIEPKLQQQNEAHKKAQADLLQKCKKEFDWCQKYRDQCGMILETVKVKWHDYTIAEYKKYEEAKKCTENIQDRTVKKQIDGCLRARTKELGAIKSDIEKLLQNPLPSYPPSKMKG